MTVEQNISQNHPTQSVTSGLIKKIDVTSEEKPHLGVGKFSGTKASEMPLARINPALILPLVSAQ